MGRGAVIAFVKVVGQNLPVVLALHAVFLVESVVIPVDLLKTFLLINTLEVASPRFRVLRAVEVDPDKAIRIDLEMDLEKAVLALVEVLELVVVGCLGEVATQSIRPTMVLACKDR